MLLAQNKEAPRSHLGEQWEDHVAKYDFLNALWQHFYSEELKRHNFLIKQMTGIYVLNDKNQYISAHQNTLPPKNQVFRIVAQFDHIELEYIAAEKTTSRKPEIRASNLKLSYDTDDVLLLEKALMERLKAALCLAYTAKSVGWTDVTFGDTTDPVDRAALFLACEVAGISTSETMSINDLPKNKILWRKELGDQVTLQECFFGSMKTFIAEMTEEKSFSFGITPHDYEAGDIEDSNMWDDLDPDSNSESTPPLHNPHAQFEEPGVKVWGIPITIN